MPPLRRATGNGSVDACRLRDRCRIVTSINGEWSSRQGDVRAALQHFKKVLDFGLPIFSDGYAMAMARLRQHASPANRSIFGVSHSDAATELLSNLAPWAPYVISKRLLLTFRGSTPAEPGEHWNTSSLADYLSDAKWFVQGEGEMLHTGPSGNQDAASAAIHRESGGSTNAYLYIDGIKGPSTGIADHIDMSFDLVGE